MDTINKLFEQVKDIKELRAKLENKTNCLKEVQEKIKLLILEKEQLLDESFRVDDLKEELKNIEIKMKHVNLKDKKLTKLSDFDDDILRFEDDVLKEKCISFIDCLIYDWLEYDELSVFINKETKDFFKLIRQKNFYNELKKIYYKKIENLLENVVYEDFLCEDRENEVVLYIKNKINDKKENINDFYMKNKEVSNFLFQALKSNLEKRVVNLIREKDLEFVNLIDRNSFLIEDTRFRISDKNNYTLNLVTKTLLEICSMNRENIKIDPLQKNISKEFSIILFIIEYLEKINIKIDESQITDFFNINKVKINLFNLFCIFSEISLFQAQYKNLCPALSKIKENVFCLIIKNAGTSEILFTNSISLETLKIDIYENNLAFKEILEFFIDENLRSVFWISYFDLLNNYLCKYIISLKSISIDDSEIFSELIKYIFQLCPYKTILSTYCKMKCYKYVLTASMVDIERFYDDNSLCLDKSEIQKLIISIFNDSPKRQKLLEKITK